MENNLKIKSKKFLAFSHPLDATQIAKVKELN